MKVYYGEIYDNELYKIDGCWALCDEYVYETLGTMPEKIKITVSNKPHKGATKAKLCEAPGNGKAVIIRRKKIDIYKKAYDIIKEVSPVTKTVYFKIEEAE